MCQNASPQPSVAQSRGASESQLSMAVCEGPDVSQVPEELELAVVPSPARSACHLHSSSDALSVKLRKGSGKNLKSSHQQALCRRQFPHNLLIFYSLLITGETVENEGCFLKNEASNQWQTLPKFGCSIPSALLISGLCLAGPSFLCSVFAKAGYKPLFKRIQTSCRAKRALSVFSPVFIFSSSLVPHP